MWRGENLICQGFESNLKSGLDLNSTINNNWKVKRKSGLELRVLKPTNAKVNIANDQRTDDTADNHTSVAGCTQEDRFQTFWKQFGFDSRLNVEKAAFFQHLHAKMVSIGISTTGQESRNSIAGNLAGAKWANCAKMPPPQVHSYFGVHQDLHPLSIQLKGVIIVI